MSVEAQLSTARRIRELNTPDDIYNEWMESNNQISLGDAGSSSDIFIAVTESPSMDAVQSTISEMYSIVDTMLLTGATNYRSMAHIHRKIYRCVMFYYDIPSTYYVKTELKSSIRSHQLISYIDQLEREGCHVFVLLANCGIHMEYISNPAFPKSILSQLNDNLFHHVMVYVQCIQNIFSILSASTIIKQLVNRIYTAPATERVEQIKSELLRIYNQLKETERSISKYSHLDSSKWALINDSITCIDALTPLLNDLFAEYQSLKFKQSVVKLFQDAETRLAEGKNAFTSFNIPKSLSRMKSFAKKMCSALEMMQSVFVIGNES